jgi:hypothetical protein
VMGCGGVLDPESIITVAVRFLIRVALYMSVIFRKVARQNVQFK